MATRRLYGTVRSINRKTRGNAGWLDVRLEYRENGRNKSELFSTYDLTMIDRVMGFLQEGASGYLDLDENDNIVGYGT